MNVTPLPESFNWLLTEGLIVTGLAVGRTETCASFRIEGKASPTAAVRSLPDGAILVCGKAYDLGDDYPRFLGLLDAAVKAGCWGRIPADS